MGGNIIKKIICAFLLSVILLLIIFSESAISGARAGVDTCLYVVIPSLFPFFVISKMLVLSDSAYTLGLMIHPVTKRVFSITPKGSFIFIIGILCGYPIGAKVAADMVKSKEITAEEAQRLICFCNNSGPLFVIGAVGCVMFASLKTGLILYAVHVLSAITLGIVLRKPVKNSSYDNKPRVIQPYFTKAVEDGMNSVISISGYIIFFAALCSIISSVLSENAAILSFIICIVTEITSGIKSISETYGISSDIKIVITSFLLGFGGICITYQVKSVTYGSGLKIMPYALAKLFQGAISAIYMNIILTLFPIQVSFNSFTNHSAIESVIFALLVICALMIIVYLFKINRQKSNIKQNRRI